MNTDAIILCYTIFLHQALVTISPWDKKNVYVKMGKIKTTVMAFVL